MASQVTTGSAGAEGSWGSRGLVVFGRRLPVGVWSPESAVDAVRGAVDAEWDLADLGAAVLGAGSVGLAGQPVHLVRPLLPLKVFETVTHGPGHGGRGPGPGRRRHQEGPTAYIGNLAQNQVRRVDKFIDSINAEDPQPTLYFLHVLLPTQPGSTCPTVGSGTPRRCPTPKVVARILQRLKDQGLYDKSLVMMTADHGDGFTPGNGSRGLGPGNAAQLMWVPSFIKAPGHTKGRIDDRNWEHVDLLPTMADIVGLSIPWKVDGLAQTGPPQRQTADKTFYNHPGEPLHRPGPNFATVLHGVTDTLIRAHQNGERGFWQYGATADWIYLSPAKLGRIGGPPVTVKIRD